MTKPRRPHSASTAFNRSVVALKPDGDGRDGYERAAAIVGNLTQSHLEKCGVTGGRPVTMDTASAIDLALCLEGGEPINEDAMQERRLAALAGMGAPDPDPAFLLRRALHDLAEARRLLEWGKGNLRECAEIWRQIHKLQDQLLDVIATREGRRAGEDLQIVGGRET